MRPWQKDWPHTDPYDDCWAHSGCATKAALYLLRRHHTWWKVSKLGGAGVPHTKEAARDAVHVAPGLDAVQAQHQHVELLVEVDALQGRVHITKQFLLCTMVRRCDWLSVIWQVTTLACIELQRQ